MTNANRKYRDGVFTLFFSDRERLIEVFNAIENKSYPPDADVSINTLEDALYMDRLNDISFLLDGRLVVLIEHQSSLNRNMPLRLLLYIGRVYEKILETANIYRDKAVKIPKPDLIVLYNGEDDYPDSGVMRLSDAFEDVDIPDLLELTVRIYNINKGRNSDILQRSKSLGDYAAFVGRVRENAANGISLAEAIKEAVLHCMDNGIMKEFLEEHGSEGAPVRRLQYSEVRDLA